MILHKINYLCVLVCALFIIGCSVGSQAKKDLPKADVYAPEYLKSEKTAKTKMPWQTDPYFKKELKKYPKVNLIASYQATLPDPILNERHNIALAAKYLKGAVVEPGETFSLNGRIGWRSVERGFKPGPVYLGGRISSAIGGGICKVASVTYNVAVLANQEIIERHPHSMTVPYVPPGQDATISYGTKDFKFKNISNDPILIWAQNTGGTLYVAFYGKYQAPKIEWIHETLSKSKTWTEYVWDYSLPKGTEKTLIKGSEGISVHSKLKISLPDGSTTIKDLGISAYRPCPRVVAKGSR